MAATNETSPARIAKQVLLSVSDIAQTFKNTVSAAQDVLSQEHNTAQSYDNSGMTAQPGVRP